LLARIHIRLLKKPPEIGGFQRISYAILRGSTCGLSRKKTIYHRIHFFAVKLVAGVPNGTVGGRLAIRFCGFKNPY
jgi:hypothetical protein